jgi:hypothetical protein
MKTGVLATLRLLFAKIRVDECYRDFAPVGQRMSSETADENSFAGPLLDEIAE